MGGGVEKTKPANEWNQSLEDTNVLSDIKKKKHGSSFYKQNLAASYANQFAWNLIYMKRFSRLFSSVWARPKFLSWKARGLIWKSLNSKLWINSPQRQDSGCPQTNCQLDSFQFRFGTFEVLNVICLLSVFTPSIEEVWEVLTQRGSTRLFVGITFSFAAFPLHVKTFAIQDSNLCFVSSCSHSFYIKSDVTDKQPHIVIIYIHVSSWALFSFSSTHY